MSPPGVCVLLFATAPDAATAPDGAASVAQAYHTISRELAGTPGLRRNALLELVDSPGRFVVLSEWASLDEFRAWETGPDHRQVTAPLRPHQDRSAAAWFGVYHVAATYDG